MAVSASGTLRGGGGVVRRKYPLFPFFCPITLFTFTNFYLILRHRKRTDKLDKPQHLISELCKLISSQNVKVMCEAVEAC